MAKKNKALDDWYKEAGIKQTQKTKSEQRQETASKLSGAAKKYNIPQSEPAQIKASRSPMFEKAVDFLSNPVYYAEKAFIDPLDDASRHVFSAKATTAAERERQKQNENAPAASLNAGRMIAGWGVKAADDIVSGVAGLGDMTLGTAARAFGWKDNPFSNFAEATKATQAANRAYYDKNVEKAGKVVQTVDTLGTALVEALPQLAIAYMTGGSNIASGTLAKGGTMLAGTEAAQAASKLPGAIKTAQSVASGLKSNPQFWASFVDTTGRAYNTAKEDGADDWKATMYATTTGLINAAIEVGGGIQTLPTELQKGGKALMQWLDSAVDEGKEEVVQGIVERGMQALVYGKDNPLFSLTDENAVFNPVTSAKEFGSGFAIGGLLSAGPVAINSRSNVTPDMIAEVVKASPNVKAEDVLNLANNAAVAQSTEQSNNTQAKAENATQANTSKNTTESAKNGAAELGKIEESIKKSNEYDGYRVEYFTDTDSLSTYIYVKTPDGRKLKDSVDYLGGVDSSIRAAQMISDDIAQQNQTQAAPESVQTEPQARTAAQDIDEITQTLGKNPTWDDLISAAQNSENGAEMYQRVAAAVESGELIDAGNSGIFPKSEIERRQTAFPEANHIDNRAESEIRKPSVKAFQHELPELHQHFVTVANKILEEAAISLDRGVTKVPKKYGGGTQTYYDDGIATVMGKTNLSRQKIIEVCQDIINNHGSENYADAKRVEMALDYLMSNVSGYEDADYRQKKDAIKGGRPVGSWEDFLRQNELLLALGEVTEEELRKQWLDEVRQENAAQNAQNAPVSNPNSQAVQDSTPTAENSESSLTNRQTNGLPQGQGAMSAQFPYRETQSQTRSLDSALTAEERTKEGMRPGDITHQVRTDKDVDAHAKERFDFDYDGEKESLFNGDGEWDAVDTALAEMIIANEVIEANKTGDYSEVVRLRKSMAERNTNWGQVGHTLARYSETPEATIAEAATTLSEDQFSHLKDEAKSKIMEEVKKESYALQNAKRTGKPENVVDIIKRLNGKRKTGGFFRPKHTGRTLEKTLNAVAKQDGGMDFLYKVAQGQINGLVTDNLKLSPLETLKSVRYMSMLSKITTYMRNLGGNNVFDLTESVSTDAGTLFDLFMSARTGRRALPFDKSWFSKAKREGTSEATQRAYIETALDVDVSGIQGSYEQRTGRNFKMASRNPLIRFLSSVEKWQKYALNVTDEAQKGGIQAEAQRGIDRLKARGRLEQDALEDAAEKTAKDRTFQSEDGRVAGALLDLRNAGNRWSYTDSKGGSLGLGDLALPFARVPGNLVGQLANYSPVGVVNGIIKMGNVMIKGKNATAEEQRAAALAVGRGLNGTAILTAFAAMAANGLLNVADGGDTDDEKDLAKLEQAGGVTGTQWNVSATERWKNGESTEWRYDDNLVNIGFLEPINGLMALGSLLWDSAQDEDGITALDVANASFESVMQAFADLPAMSTVTNIANTYKYSTAENAVGKAAEAAASFVGSSLTSIVPNALAGIAQGVDEGTVRDAYATEKSGLPGVAEETLNVAKSKIPGLRETLPVSLDNLGNERKTTASAFMNWLNSNILPGSITKYQSTRISEEAKKLAETGEKLNVPDRKAPNKISVDGEDVKLSAEQKRAYQQTYGAEASKGLNSLIQSKEYRKMSSAEKAAAWNNVVNYAEAKAKQKVDGKKNEDSDLPSWATKSDGTVTQNAAYNAMYKAARDAYCAKNGIDTNSMSDAEKIAAVASKNYPFETAVQIMKQAVAANSTAIEKVQAAKTYTNDNYKDGVDPLTWAKIYMSADADGNGSITKAEAQAAVAAYGAPPELYHLFNKKWK